MWETEKIFILRPTWRENLGMLRVRDWLRDVGLCERGSSHRLARFDYQLRREAPWGCRCVRAVLSPLDRQLVHS